MILKQFCELVSLVEQLLLDLLSKDRYLWTKETYFDTLLVSITLLQIGQAAAWPASTDFSSAVSRTWILPMWWCTSLLKVNLVIAGLQLMYTLLGFVQYDSYKHVSSKLTKYVEECIINLKSCYCHSIISPYELHPTNI